MQNKNLGYLYAFAALLFLMVQACKDDSGLTVKNHLPTPTLTESFDNYQDAYAKGWRAINKSNPPGRKWFDVAETPDFGSVNYLVTYFPDWNQAQFSLDRAQFPNAPYPNRLWMPAYRSQQASNGYVAASIASASPIGIGRPSVFFDVSNWLVSPVTSLQNGDKIVFYTFSKGLSRLQLWLNLTGSLNAGSDISNTGDFTIKLLDINPSYAKAENNPANAFPTEWTRFEGEVKGLQAPVVGRFGFRYYMQDQSPIRPSQANPNNFDTLYTQIHKSVIGIDEVTLTGIR